MFRSIVAAAIALFSLLPGAAWAAPQIMGLVATAEPAPMQCAGGQCTALLSAFCLQEKRLPPDLGSAYLPAASDQVVLVVTAADGRTTRMEAGGLVEFHSRYGYTAIEARLPLDRLAVIQPVALALEVKPRAALLPVAKAGDPDPLTAEEIATATGPWRLAAEAAMEGDSQGVASARTAMRLINALPTAGDIRPGERGPLWRRVAGDAPAHTRQSFDACIRSVDQSIGYPLRKCLEERHEQLQVENTREFWRSLGGS
ncbi:MAG: hypothetical protein KAJ11_02280 [Alphaproteobacteria bacterium]|nr:hypothetical protein [Alphaproteobacteria bacterium]